MLEPQTTSLSPEKILGQKFLHEKEISVKMLKFWLKMGLTLLKQLSRNFCTRSKILSNFETLNIA